jgi:hypothetical protein
MASATGHWAASVRLATDLYVASESQCDSALQCGAKAGVTLLRIEQALSRWRVQIEGRIAPGIDDQACRQVAFTITH